MLLCLITRYCSISLSVLIISALFLIPGLTKHKKLQCLVTPLNLFLSPLVSRVWCSLHGCGAEPVYVVWMGMRWKRLSEPELSLWLSLDGITLHHRCGSAGINVHHRASPIGSTLLSRNYILFSPACLKRSSHSFCCMFIILMAWRTAPSVRNAWDSS